MKWWNLFYFSFLADKPLTINEMYETKSQLLE